MQKLQIYINQEFAAGLIDFEDFKSTEIGMKIDENDNYYSIYSSERDITYIIGGQEHYQNEPKGTNYLPRAQRNRDLYYKKVREERIQVDESVLIDPRDMLEKNRKDNFKLKSDRNDLSFGTFTF